jgi:hypothetical protein
LMKGKDSLSLADVRIDKALIKQKYCYVAG